MTDQTNPQEALKRLIRWRDRMEANPDPDGTSVERFHCDVLALLSLVEKQQEALKAAKLWFDEYTDPCGEPYNTICAALQSREAANG